jgi:pSer/pThr/pTyr-binding forkhead associated (FHA) protein
MNCPNGHLSSSDEYCSVCGTKMSADPEAVAADNPSATLWRVECRVFKASATDTSNPSAPYERSIDLVLKDQVTQIGRSSQKRNLHPEIACDWDAAVSHRHAKIELDPDGNAFLVDVGSSNGTMLNGQMISANTPMKLKDGDRISLGNRTALIIREAREVRTKESEARIQE